MNGLKKLKEAHPGEVITPDPFYSKANMERLSRSIAQMEAGGSTIHEVSTMIKGILAYNPENDRYGLLRSDLWEIDGFHCGETLDVQIDGEWIPARMEMSIEGEWYLAGTPYRGEELQFLTVRVGEDDESDVYL